MIIKSSKKSEVAAALATLKINKTYSIEEIVDTIKQVCNHQTDTTNSLKMVSGNYSGMNTIPLDELYVDMTYQRRIRLAKIINKLKKVCGFDKDVAGAIDIALRPSGKHFVWDGLRRAIMVGMCGGDRIGASLYTHNTNLYDDECRKVEGRFYKIRNADDEKLAFEEIFKAKVAYKDPIAISQLGLLKECELDVEGLNEKGVQLGGLRAFDEIYSKIDVKASKLYRYAWNNQPQVLGYGLAGLATLLSVEGFEDYYDYDDVRSMLRDYALNNKPNTITNPRINSEAFKSIAYNIATKVLKDENGLKSALLDSEQMEVMESF